MTIMDALGAVDSLKHNTYPRNAKIAWLSRLDSRVSQEIIDTHEGSENVSFAGYREDTMPDTVLLIPEPYDEVYLWWLAAQIDLGNGEIAQYNESITLFNTAWGSFENWYNRTHMPRGSRFRYF